MSISKMLSQKHGKLLVSSTASRMKFIWLNHLKSIGYEVDANQELLAMGLANLFGGFFGSYPAAGSLSR
jgi:hypothetical protein